MSFGASAGDVLPPRAGERTLPTTRALRCPSRKSWSTAPTRTAICIVIVAALTGVIGCLGRPIAVLRKVSDKEYEQRPDRVCSWYTKGEIDRKAPLWLPAGLGCMRL